MQVCFLNKPVRVLNHRGHREHRVFIESFIGIRDIVNLFKYNLGLGKTKKYEHIQRPYLTEVEQI